MSLAILTGASGLIGSAILPEICKKHDKVLTVGRSSLASVASNHEHYPLFQHGRKTGFILPNWKPTHIYHFAGDSDPNPNFVDPFVCINGNLRFTANLLSTYRKSLQRFTFASTIKVYGESLSKKQFGQPCAPQCLYGASKLACENFIRSYADVYDFEYDILRFSNVVDPFNPRGLIKFIASQVDKPVIEYPNCHRPYIGIDKVVKFMGSDFPSGGYNIAGSHAFSSKELINMMCLRRNIRREGQVVPSLNPLECEHIYVDSFDFYNVIEPGNTLWQRTSDTYETIMSCF